MANRRFIDFPIAASVGNNDIVLIWQDGLNKQTTKATLLQGSPQSLAGLTDVDISALTNGQILQYNSTTSKWENVDRTDINLSELGDVTIVAPSNGQVLVYNSSTGKWENSSGGYVPYTGAVTTVNLGAQTIQAGSFVKAGGTSAQFLKANGSVDSTAYGTGTVTSVALTMPSAFSVGGSPITTAGTLAVTGAGTVGQYIRGDGSLADFPATTGGGSSVSYYLNGSVSQGTIGGVAYREINRTPIFGAGTDISISSDGYIANFITDAGDPNKLEIPAGNWNLETYFSASSSGGTPSFYVELYKYNGTTFTLIASSSSSPELIAFGTNLNPYFSTLAVPQTTLALTDRLALRFYVNTSGRTITLHTENDHLCQVITTFTTGLTALNGLTSQVQFFAVGTSGTDFAISSATDTHTFNLPTASATNRGALSSADWTTFNNKQNALTLTTTGTSGAATLVGSTLNIPQYQAAGTYVTAVTASSPLASSGGTTPNITIQQASGSQSGFLSSTDWTTFNNKQNALTNPVTGTGTTNYLPKFTGASTIGNSIVQDNGSTITVGGSVNLTASTSFPTVGLLNRTSDSTLYIVSPASGFSITDNSLNTIYNGTPTAHNWNISNAVKMQLTANGNLLVGTTTDAGYKLDVNGTGRFSNNANSGNQFIIRNTTAGSSSSVSVELVSDSTAAQGSFGKFSSTTSAYKIVTSSNTYLYNGTSAGDIAILNDFASGAIKMAAGGSSTAQFILTSGGNVGIGTTSPTSTFDITGASAGGITQTIRNTQAGVGAGSGFRMGNNLAVNRLEIFTLSSTYTTAGAYVSDGSSITNEGTGGLSIGATNAAGVLRFYTAGTGTANERMRITSGGNVLIGTTTDSGGKLRVDGDVFINNTSNAQIGFNTTGAVGATGAYLYFNRSGSNKWTAGMGPYTGGNNYEIATGSVVALSLAVTTGTATFGSLGTGTVTATSGTLSTVSDSSYKIDDGYIDSAIEKVLNLKPRYFYWNEKSGLPKDKRQLGFYAQEVNMALGEEAANTPQDKNTPWGISDRSMIAMLTKAIQEQQEIINDLKQKIA